MGRESARQEYKLLTDRGADNWKKECDTSIWPEWRGSAQPAERAGREDGRKEKVEEWSAGWSG